MKVSKYRYKIINIRFLLHKLLALWQNFTNQRPTFTLVTRDKILKDIFFLSLLLSVFGIRLY